MNASDKEKARGKPDAGSDSAVLRISNVSKRFPNGTLAVDNLNLQLKRGEVFGILGPNGSGKTTTIMMLLGLTEPTEGSVNILGYDPLRSPLAVKERVGYMPDTVGFYDDLTAFENLDYTAKFLGLNAAERRERIVDALSKMGLSANVHQRVRTFSHGMRRRLGLAEVLMKKPEIAVLDEPTQGLDPESVAEFLDLIRYLKEHEGISILLSSHQLNEVQSVCDRVGLFRNGKMGIAGSIDELSSKIFGGKLEIFLTIAEPKKDRKQTLDAVRTALENISDVEKVVENQSDASSAAADGISMILFTLECGSDVRPDVVSAVTAAGGRIFEISLHRHSLDALYKAYFRKLKDQEVAYESQS
jgi:ABC-2 type transport system ATP-binding protein